MSKEVGRPPKTIWRKIGKPKGIHKSFLAFHTMRSLRINLYLGNVIIFIFSNILKVEHWENDIGLYTWTPVWLAAEISYLILPLNLTIGPSGFLLNYTSFPPNSSNSSYCSSNHAVGSTHLKSRHLNELLSAVGLWAVRKEWKPKCRALLPSIMLGEVAPPPFFFEGRESPFSIQ